MTLSFIKGLLLLALFLGGCSREKENLEIRKALDGYEEAFNRHQATAMAHYWEKEGTYSNPKTQSRLEGRLQGSEEIARHFAELFKKFPKAKLNLTVDQMTFSSPSKAEIQATASLTDLGDISLQVKFKATLLQREGQWRFLHLDVLQKEPGPGAGENLRELDWLIGLLS